MSVGVRIIDVKLGLGEHGIIESLLVVVDR